MADKDIIDFNKSQFDIMVDMLVLSGMSKDDAIVKVTKDFEDEGMVLKNRGGMMDINRMTVPLGYAAGGPAGLYANIHAKRKRIKAGSGEKMRQVGSQGAPTQQSFIDSAKTAKKAGGGMMNIDGMAVPLGYDNGGDVDLAAIMADMEASKAPTPTSHPIQKIIEDRSPVNPYSVLTDNEFKRKNPLEMLQTAPGKALEGIRSLFGARAAEAGPLVDFIKSKRARLVSEVSGEMIGDISGTGVNEDKIKILKIEIDKLTKLLEDLGEN